LCYNQNPKLGMKIQDCRMAIALCYFKTGCAYQNKKIKENLEILGCFCIFEV